jgi:DNA-binding NtrC family response regulator
MSQPSLLLVDDDELIRVTVEQTLKEHGFQVTMASSVPEALKLISTNIYDVLLSDLHMPGAGDGLTVVSAMRHANPKAVTILLSAFPEMDAASHAILLQADQILVKPMDVSALVEAIKERLAMGPPVARSVESVATILERTAESTIQDWFGHIRKRHNSYGGSSQPRAARWSPGSSLCGARATSQILRVDRQQRVPLGRSG